MTVVVEQPGDAPDKIFAPSTTAPSSRRLRLPSLPAATDLVKAARSGPPLTRGAVVAIWVVVAVSASALFFVLSATWLSGFQYHRSNAVLFAQLREGLSQATTPTGGAIAPGTPLAVVAVPALGLVDQVVVEGSDAQQTSRAIGHRPDTVLPGQIGVSLLYGRSTTYGGVFGHIADLRAGQKILVTTAQGSFTYEVERVRRAGDPGPSTLDADGSRITLSTATGSPVDPTGVVAVDAKIVGQAVRAPGGRPAAVSDAQKALGTNTNSLVPLVFWLQAFVLAAIAATWAGLRWGRWQTWMVATPVLLGTLWQVMQQLLLFLPNLF